MSRSSVFAETPSERTIRFRRSQLGESDIPTGPCCYVAFREQEERWSKVWTEAKHLRVPLHAQIWEFCLSVRPQGWLLVRQDTGWYRYCRHAWPSPLPSWRMRPPESRTLAQETQISRLRAYPQSTWSGNLVVGWLAGWMGEGSYGWEQ